VCIYIYVCHMVMYVLYKHTLYIYICHMVMYLFYTHIIYICHMVMYLLYTHIIYIIWLCICILYIYILYMCIYIYVYVYMYICVSNTVFGSAILFQSLHESPRLDVDSRFSPSYRSYPGLLRPKRSRVSSSCIS
jgi:hypothetical protein